MKITHYRPRGGHRSVCSEDAPGSGSIHTASWDAVTCKYCKMVYLVAIEHYKRTVNPEEVGARRAETALIDDLYRRFNIPFTADKARQLTPVQRLDVFQLVLESRVSAAKVV